MIDQTRQEGELILKADVSVAKSYPIELELKKFERIVSIYLDNAENGLPRRIR